MLSEASELDDKPDLRTYAKFGVLSNLSKILMTFYSDLGLTPDTDYIQLYKANSTGPVTAVTVFLLCGHFNLKQTVLNLNVLLSNSKIIKLTFHEVLQYQQ